MEVLLVFVGGCVGAVGRFTTDRFISRRHDSVVPWGTIAVNVVGSTVLGFVAGSAPSESWVPLLIGTGFCGALTTYSTFSFETVRLLEERFTWSALVNVVGSLAVGMVGVVTGFALGQTLL